MWVETTDGTLVNLDGAQEVSKWQGRQADDGFNLSVYGFSGDRHWTVDLINRVTEAEIEAALRRIRDALARGEQFLSLRETEPPTRLFGPEAAYALERLAHGKEVCGLTVDEAEVLAMAADDESIRVRLRVDASNPDLRCVEPW